MQLEELRPGTSVRGILPDSLVTVVNTQWYGENAVELTYKDAAGRVANEVLYRADEARLEAVEAGRPWSFDGDGALFRLVAEAHRIRLAHLFDPALAVHTSLVEPLPHQITAVYEVMLDRLPLRFLLADDPGAGKTIMAGLLMKELIARGDLHRCLVVCPGSLAEQWQDELYRRFHLRFDILTNDKLESAATGNWFSETRLAIARLDKLSRNEDVQAKLLAPECQWDLVVCDEAHKLSATFWGGEVRYTKRYKLGQLLSTVTRHFLLMTATPHNGKEEDFQLFMALLDGDRFEGKFRDGVHTAKVDDLMRRMIKEKLLKFDGTPLFPPRIAETVPYKLSAAEDQLYQAVTEYVRQEWRKADDLNNDKRASTVGFALTMLQRRLASSPEAIYQSLKRRRERLDKKLKEVELMQRAAILAGPSHDVPELDEDDIDDLEEAADDEIEQVEQEVLDQATAARTADELRAEIKVLQKLERSANDVRRSGGGRKWEELSGLLHEQLMRASKEKLVVFTEHRDTLNFLQQCVADLFDGPASVRVIHGSMSREERMAAQEAFKFEPDVRVLIATDAAGEGINLQRAHFMVNYDLPWNPNRIEQRFGRIHRIGQTEPCHLWNLVAADTREGDVYRKLLDKLSEARNALGGEVFDVLGRVQFDGKPLRELLIRAIRYGEDPKVQAHLTTVVEQAMDRDRLQTLIDDKVLDPTIMDASKVQRVREDMERADARRLQPHYIESFFLEAFARLGGRASQREGRRYEVTNVPAAIRARDGQTGLGERVLQKYERIVFDKSLIAPRGLPLGAFICPGHPLLDATLDLTLEAHRDLLKRGAVLVDDRDDGLEPRVLCILEHAVQDAGQLSTGDRRTVSRRMLYVEMDQHGAARHLHYAPYLDYRPLRDGEPNAAAVLARPECAWMASGIEQRALAHAISEIVPAHVEEIRGRRLRHIEKTRAAVKERLTKEIAHWDHRAQQLKTQEDAGKPGARLNSGEARRRAEELHARLKKRLDELARESQISAQPPVIIGGLVVVPAGLIRAMTGRRPHGGPEIDRLAVAARARAIVMEVERGLGFQPRDVEFERLGYDIESRDRNGHLRFIEVKGRASGADVLTVTKNEILHSFNKPDAFVLALVEFHDRDRHEVRYLRKPFDKTGVTSDFNGASVNFHFQDLLSRAGAPS